MARSAARRAVGGRLAAVSVAWLVGAAAPHGAWAQGLQPPLPDLGGIVADRGAAVALGKALFWDQAVGSDGMACASCHFHAGADSRTKNQISPGLLQLPKEDLKFGATAGAANGFGPNYTLKEGDFPLHKLADKNNRNSAIVSTTNDRVASSGAFDAILTEPKHGKKGDRCDDISGDVFHAGRYPARQVEPRNTPTMINAAFFARNFWDGRANNIFNGKGVFGRRDIERDKTARVLEHAGGDGAPVPKVMELANASLASQAVGPPLSSLEMACSNRTFPDVARRILSGSATPLKEQAVHAQDSVLGLYRKNSGKGLEDKYDELIEKAFAEKYWSAKDKYVFNDNGTLTKSSKGYTQMEHNFSMFFGLSIMLYEATLVSDQSRFDDANRELGGCLMAGPPNVPCSASASTVFTQQEKDGHALFVSGGFGGGPGGGCTACHAGPMFSFAASVRGAAPVGTVVRIPQADPTADGAVSPTLHDFGFFSVGVRPVDEDLGVGGTDSYGFPLSFTRQLKKHLETGPANAGSIGVDEFQVQCGTPPFAAFPDGCGAALGDAAKRERVKVDGAFKTPILRNVALTPPYFHYGGYASLEQLMDLYARGGSRRDKTEGDDSGTGPLGESRPFPIGAPHGRNVDDAVRPLDLTLGSRLTQEQGKKAIVAFLKTLTDPRVQRDAAPFDHPELKIFNGHQARDGNGDGKADDVVVTLPAVGRNGYSGTSGLCIPNAGDLFAKGMTARVGGEKSGAGDCGG